MTILRASFITFAAVAALINLKNTIFRKDNKGIYLNSFCGWMSSILYAID